jgi:dTDP-4-amino-4,6-dideoxygalactose transaminase
VRKDSVHARHLYPIIIDFTALSIDRARFIAALAAENISSNVHYIPIHTMSYYRMTYGYEPYDFPVSYGNYLHEVTLPLYPQMSDADAKLVLDAIGKLFSYYKK